MKNHFWVLAICGFALRMLAFFSGLSDSFIVERPEITGGMLNEKLSVLEALAMDDKDSTNFTINSPIFLILYGWAFSLSAPIILQLLMASVDIVSAWMMDQIAKELNSDQNWIVWIIIFNPIAIITCVSAGTITLTFVWVLIALRFALKGKELLAAISISLASHLDVRFPLFECWFSFYS